MAEPILREEGFPEDKIPSVLEAIRLHDYQTDPSERKSLESQILYDADKMDAFGVVGVKRYIMYYFCEDRTQTTIDEIIDDNLKVKYQSLHLDESRELAEEDYKYILDYFTRLREKQNA